MKRILTMTRTTVTFSLASLLTPYLVDGFQPVSFKPTVMFRPIKGYRNSNFVGFTENNLTSATPNNNVGSVRLQASMGIEDSSDSKVSSEWTKKRLHNTAAFRSLSLLAALALAGFSSRSALPSQASAVLHLLSFATWFGSVAYTTFIAGITMFKNLTRKVFGKLQAKLFPKYFALGSVTLLLQLITLRALPPVIQSLSFKALGLALIMNLINQFYLEPMSTVNMMRRYELEEQASGQDTAEYKSLKASFGKFHGMSSLTNLVALCGGVAHAVFLARALVV